MGKADESSAAFVRRNDPCKGLRNAYDRCFNRWYSESYVKMEGSWKKEDCAAEWQAYQACFTMHLQERTKISQLVKKEHDSLMHRQAPPPADRM